MSAFLSNTVVTTYILFTNYCFIIQLCMYSLLGFYVIDNIKLFGYLTNLLQCLGQIIRALV
jgi:hypothetical protein